MDASVDAVESAETQHVPPFELPDLQASAEDVASHAEPEPISEPVPDIAKETTASVSAAPVAAMSHSVAAMLDDVPVAEPIPVRREMSNRDDDRKETVSVAQFDAGAKVGSGTAIQQGPSEDFASPDALHPLAPHTWWQWLEVLPLAGLPQAIARNSALVSVAQSNYHFEVDQQQGALFNDGQRQKIEQALQTRLPGCRITMELGVPTGETPEQRRQRLHAEASYMAQQSIESDQTVRAIISQFNAVVLPDSIRPLNQQEK